MRQVLRSAAEEEAGRMGLAGGQKARPLRWRWRERAQVRVQVQVQERVWARVWERVRA